jgi:hypothetical protein
MATFLVTSSLNLDTLPWANNDTLDIYNGAVATINTTQTKWWLNMNVIQGTLLIKNESTGSGIRVGLGRGALNVNASVINIDDGGTLRVEGELISLGTGNGQPGQTFTAWCTDYIPGLFIEKSPGSATASLPEDRFNLWANVTVRPNGFSWGPYPDLIQFTANDDRGYFFKQGCTDENTIHTGSTFAAYFTNQVYFGGSIASGGAAVPNGCKVFIPNIVITDYSEARWTDRVNMSGINTDEKGCVVMRNCLISYPYFSCVQARNLDVLNVAQGTYSANTFSENRNASVINFIRTIPMAHFYIPGTGVPNKYMDVVTDRRNPDGTPYMGSQINSVFKNIFIVMAHNHYRYGGSQIGHYFESFKNCYVQDLKFQQIFPIHQLANETLWRYWNNSTLKNIKVYGASVTMGQFSDCTIDGFVYSHSSGYWNRANAFRFTSDPVQRFRSDHYGNEWQLGQKYYFKAKTYKDNNYLMGVESENVFNIVPFMPVSQSFPARLRFEPSSASVWIVWTNDNVGVAGNNATFPSQIFKSTSSVFTPSAGNSIGTFPFVSQSWEDRSVVNNTPYYYIYRRHYQNGTFEDSPIHEAIPKFTHSLYQFLRWGTTFSDATWTKNAVNVASDVTYPYSIIDNTNLTVDRLNSTGSNARVSQTVSGLLPNSTYNFCTLLCNMLTTGSVEVAVQYDSTIISSSYNLGGSWTLCTASVTLPAGVSYLTCSIGNVSGRADVFPSSSIIFTNGANLDSGSLARTIINTGATAATGSILRPYVEWQWPNMAIGTFYSTFAYWAQNQHNPFKALHVSTQSAAFAPTFENMMSWGVYTNGTRAPYFELFTNCTIKNYEHHPYDHTYPGSEIDAQRFYGGLNTNYIKNVVITNIKTNGQWKNCMRTFSVGNTTDGLVIDNLDAVPMIEGWLGSINQNQPTPAVGGNDNKNIYYQNVRHGGLYTRGFQGTGNSFGMSNWIVRNVDGGYDPYNVSIVPGASTGQGLGVARFWTQVADTNWFELNQGNGNGLLALRFNGTEKTTDLKTITSGSFGFTGDGRLRTAGLFGSASFKLPWKCRNITGFRAQEPRYYHLLTGNQTEQFRLTKPASLDVDYSINGGTFKALTAANLSAEVLPTEFDFEVRIQPNGYWVEFQNMTTNFVVGERINGQSSLITASIEAISFYSGSITQGQIKVADYGTGTAWIQNENIRSGSIVRAQVNLNSQYTSQTGGFPRAGAVMEAIDIYTNYNPSASSYPIPFVGNNRTSGTTYLF